MHLFSPAPRRLALRRPAHFPCLSLALAALLWLVLTASPPASAAPFTYTGQLLSGSSAVPTGQYDLKFSLYTAATGGSQVGSTLSLSAVPVADGVFYVQLDFGSVLTGQTLYLQTSYRPHPSPGGTPYTTQTPRNLIPTSPYADYASVSGSTNALQGTGVSATAPTTGQVLTYTGSLWTPQSVATYSAGTGLTRSGHTFSIAVPLSLTGSSTDPILSVINMGGGYGISAAGGAFAGVYGASNDDSGVSGDSATAAGVSGVSHSGYGVYGYSNSAEGGHFLSAGGTNGVYGESDSTDGDGVEGVDNFGSSGYGVYGFSTSGYGVAGSGNLAGVYGISSDSGLAGFFEGNVNVTGDLNVVGNVSKSGGSFKIDHPLDPANKYLYHSFVESPDMKNIYDGTVVLGSDGAAWVQMPKWFEALNQDFRYQLTAVGAPGPNLYIAQKVKGNMFQIAGGQPGAEVSWQVTGTRHDAWANAHRIPVEEEKPEKEQGLYLHPKEFGQPEAMGIGYAQQQARQAHGPKQP